MTKVMRVLQLASVYTCMILGAGFASGKEIMHFFTQYGALGFIGLFLSGILFSLVGWAVLDITYNNKIKSYGEFMELIMGKVLGKAMTNLTALFLCILFCAMLSGAGEIAYEAFDVPHNIGIMILGCFCFASFLFDVEGILAINSMLAPFLIAGSIFIGIYTFVFDAQETFLSISTLSVIADNFLFSAILYVSYNIITAISVLSEMGGVLMAKWVGKWGAILGGSVTVFLALCLQMPLFINYSRLRYFDIPMLNLTMEYGGLVKAAYVIILILAIYTTAIAAGFALLKWLEKTFDIKGIAIKLLLIVAGYIAAHIGFSNFVVKIYPIFGYVGFLQIVFVLFYFLSKNEKKYTKL